MNAIRTIRRLPGIFDLIERGAFLPVHSYHLRGRKGRVLGITGDSLCYPLKQSGNAEQLKKWLIELEDRRFYQHGAVDWRGILRASIKNLGARKITQGGSTITQQLARTLFLDASRTWIRKLAETIIAFKLEKHLTKEEILNAYCDFVYMGRGSRGFEAASRVVYRRSFDSLAPSNIPPLVGLLGAPERFHPGNDEKKFWIRAGQKARVLGADVKNIPINPIRLSRTCSKRIENAVKVELNRLGLSQRDIKSIELTIDEGLQGLIDKELKEISRVSDVRQIAAVVICNKSGDVLAESAWGRGVPSEFSPSFSGRIQPGSTFKTFALLAAIESGLPTDMIFESAPYQSPNALGGPWSVRNYGDSYRGELSLEDALVMSDNSVFARLSELLGVDDLAATYERFSLVEKQSFTRAAILGGVREGLSLLRITNAYASIARNGVAIEPRLIRFVEYQSTANVCIGSGGQRVVAEYEVIQKLKKILARSGIQSLSLSLPGKTGTTRERLNKS